MEVTFLGTGTSHGIPVIGCNCKVCQSPNPRNRRNRTGVWVHDSQRSLVIDVSSEFRIASLQYGLKRLDLALLTHAHSDHISGLDDLRIFSQVTGKPTLLCGDENTFADLRKRFDYAFAPPKNYGGGTPQFELKVITEPFVWEGWVITPLPVWHGPDPIIGWRINNFAFITDVTIIPDSTLQLLQGLDILALDCLRKAPHSTHLHLAQSIAYAEQIKARRSYMVHLAHELEHDETESELPENCFVAYDGLTLKSD